MEPQRKLLDQIEETLGRYKHLAELTVQDERLRGPDADKVFLDARLDGLEGIVRLVLEEIETVRAAL